MGWPYTRLGKTRKVVNNSDLKEMRYYPIFIVFILLPSSIFSQEINYKKNFIDESKIIKTFSEIKSSSFNYLKPLIKKKPKKDKSSKGINSRIRILIIKPFTIQYVHSSGFGIAMNDIAFDEYKTNVAEYSPHKPVMTFTPSYSILLENYSFGLGLSNFSGGKANISGCPSYHACYEDMVDITHGTIFQFIFSYNISDTYELLSGVNFLNYRFKEYQYTDNKEWTNDSDYNLFEEYVKEVQINLGVGYVF